MLIADLFSFKLPNFRVGSVGFEILIAVVLFIDSFLSSFLQASISQIILRSQANISRLGLWLVQVGQGLLLFHKLKFIGLNVQRGMPYTEKKSHCTFASQCFPSQHLYRLEVTAM